MKKSLEQYDVPVNIVLDSAVGCVIEDIDYVLVGAEAVVENGGIINKVLKEATKCC
jgi:translation initiation factor eIF-2B subunit alpha